MKILPCTSLHPYKQKGALLILTLLILLVVSVLGMASIDSTGLEMKMSSNSRAQQQAFEAAEYTLSWVENDIVANGYFSVASIKNETGCDDVCFSDACTNGYCFSGYFGTNPATEHADCRVFDDDGPEPYESAALWADGSGKHRTLDIPNVDITAKYIIEFWCYTALDQAAEKDQFNYTPMYRITAFTVGEGGKARAMLRSTIREI
jgi:type IV pilus assembly protein PilX